MFPHCLESILRLVDSTGLHGNFAEIFGANLPQQMTVVFVPSHDEIPSKEPTQNGMDFLYGYYMGIIISQYKDPYKPISIPPKFNILAPEK